MAYSNSTPSLAVRSPSPKTERGMGSPRHVAIVSDGSGRWAFARGLSVTDGHAAAARTVVARTLDAAELGIEELTVYAFSTENWSRPDPEVRGLIAVIAERLASDTPELHKQGVRIRCIGDREGIPERLTRQFHDSESLTANNRRITLFIAFNYGGRAEILHAAKRFTGDTEEEFRRCLYVPDMHDPDLVIRTGKEQRLSNYLLWQSAYAELVFCDELWPDFTRATFEQALAEFRTRARRFGRR